MSGAGAPAYAAVDLGAESGRVVVGHVDDAHVQLRDAHRFANRPLALPDGLHWNLLSLLDGALDGLRAAAAQGPLSGVAVDAWGVDYGLLDERGRLLGLPYHYRDGRTAGMVERAFARVGADELYAVTGIQTLPFNTVFQLLADEGSPALEGAAQLALVPDLFSYWLSGELRSEATVASTTGLLDARRGAWADAIVARLGLPARVFGPLTEPGTLVGPMLAAHGVAGVPVYAVASHDTASAFVAAPLAGPGAAVLSSGTWSLLGLELGEPVLDDRARALNLTNERGVGGTTRLLKNVMGLWLVQECRRAWEADGEALSYDALQTLAAEHHGDVPVFDPDDASLLAPGDMPARIAALCERCGGRAPASPAELVRSVLVSLACAYRNVLEALEAVSGRTIETVHVIGGGARNTLLCQLTADMSGRRVLSGPVEATALGNVLVQAWAAGGLGSLADARSLVAASFEPVVYEPDPARGSADESYGRYLAASARRRELTGATP